MKKVLLLLLSLLFTNAYSGWVYISSVPSGQAINSISIVNANVIWVCCDGNQLYKTTNGGVSWLLRNAGLPSGSLYGISALDTTSCWVGTVAGSIYRTTNGGFNWTLQFSLSGSFSNGIKMFNSNYGVYYGDPTGSGQPYQFRYTTNGGTNWNLSPGVPIAASEFGVINAWDYTDTAHFWIGSANTVASATTAKVFYTTAGYGGGGWITATLSGTGGTAGLYYQAIGFSDNSNGIAGSNGTNIRRTTNGGSTWAVSTNPGGLTSYAAINMTGMKDGSGIIRASINTVAANYMYRTIDLGQSWTQETLPAQGTANILNHVQFLDGSLGYAAGATGVFIKYTNIMVKGKLIVEGFYDATSNSMRIKDTVRLYLRNSTSPYAVVDSAKSAVDSVSLTGYYLFENAGAGTYYIQSKHRNALETWSKAGGESYSPGNVYNYDFTSAASQAFGSNEPQVDASPVRFAFYSGDPTQDGSVDLSDIVLVFNDASIFNSGYVITDINGDGFVDLSDIVITFNNSSQFVSVVRP